MLIGFSHVQLFVTPWTVARQAPLSMSFSRLEYWSGLPCPPPRDLPGPGIKPTSLMSPALAAASATCLLKYIYTCLPICTHTYVCVYVYVYGFIYTYSSV